jgi:hypothetical protein
MRKQRHSKAKGPTALRLWTYPEAAAAVPYLRSVVRSLREHWLDAQGARRRVRRIDERPGRPGREALILRAEAVGEAEQAEESFVEALNELLALNVSCLDPAKGLALIPFRQGDELAWFIFDLFAPRGLDGWRFHADPLSTRRPLAEPLDTGLVDQVFSQTVGIGQ